MGSIGAAIGRAGSTGWVTGARVSTYVMATETTTRTVATTRADALATGRIQRAFRGIELRRMADRMVEFDWAWEL